MSDVSIGSLQTIRILVSGPDDANTMFVTTGLAAVGARIMDNDATTPASGPS